MEKKCFGKRLVVRGNNDYWNWSRLYSNYPNTIMFMTAQIANGGYKIYPKIVIGDENEKQPDDKFTSLYMKIQRI